MSELPKGWISTELENLFIFVLGGDWGEDPSFNDDDYEFVYCIRGTEFKSWYKQKGATSVLRKVSRSSLEKRTLHIGDILIEISGGGPDQPVGRTILIDEHALNTNKNYAKVCTNFIRLARPYAGINSSYLNYYLNSFYLSGEVTKYQGGSNNLRNLKFKEYSQILVPLAPLNEQIRIADKLDSILAKVNTAQERLEKIPGILKRFRQSVLAAATSAELTREWRNTGVLSSENWERKTLRDVATSLDPNPSHRYPESDSTGVPILSTQQFVGLSGWTTDKAKLVSREFFEERKEKTGFYSDDIIFARKGRLGLARFAPKNLDYVYSHTVFIVRASKLILSKYLLWFLRDESVIDWLIKEMNSNTGVPTLGKAVFDKLPIVLPSLEEQSEIVRRIETLFELADAVESQYIAAKHRVDRINQAILDKAFRGELVKQNPNDVPASELLKHIKSSADDIKPKKKAVSKSTAVKTKINKQVVSDLSERVDENFISDLSAEKHNGFDSLRESHQTEIQKAQELLVDAKFSVEQFRSITEFKGGYDELKALIMNLLKGIPSVSEPVLAIERWDEKSGDYLMRLVNKK